LLPAEQRKALTTSSQGFDARLDFSYGVYIYAYPLQQTLTLLGGHALGEPAYLALSVIGASLLGWFSYRWIEQPSLELKGWQLGRAVPQPARAP
jgi:peptidoglycan/LPS O-acetylase OafA/YrhL